MYLKPTHSFEVRALQNRSAAQRCRTPHSTFFGIANFRLLGMPEADSVARVSVASASDACLGPNTRMATTPDALVLPELLNTVIGVGVPSAAVIIMALGVSRWAIASAVTHAAQRELERTKADLQQTLEASKHQFARDLAAQQQAAARDLERFKAELTFTAEVRRTVAARKVAAFIELVGRATRLAEEVSTIPPRDTLSRNRALATLEEFVAYAESERHFLGEESCAAFLSSGATLRTFLTTEGGTEPGFSGRHAKEFRSTCTTFAMKALLEDLHA
jgi:hypothetical protein